VEQWQVRDESGTVFVADGFEALKGWVVDGRVSPVSEVSLDGDEWIPAVQLRELEMNCIVELEPGSFYGPIHQSAMRGLIEAGSVPADAAFYCRDLERESSGEQLTTEDVVPDRYGFVLEKLSVAETEISRAESKVQRVSAELAALLPLYSREKERGCELYEKVEGLKQDFERVSAERDLFSDQVKTHKAEVAQCQLKLSENQTILEERALSAQEAVSSLSELNSGLRLQVDALNQERDNFRVEIEVLSKNKQSQVKLMEERDMLHQEQIRDMDASCNLKQRSSSNDASTRKLVVLKNLFAEAVLLLDEDKPSGDDASGSTQRDPEESELIEYEEVSPGEVHVGKAAPGLLKSNPTLQEAHEKEVPFKAKVKRKWAFGRWKNNSNHGSLVELEARAQIELQRLSSSQDIASIFEPNK